MGRNSSATTLSIPTGVVVYDDIAVDVELSEAEQRRKRSMGLTLPPVAVELGFEGLSLRVPTKEGKETTWKTILEDLTGTFVSGELTAIMGSSGAGKTTFLNVLAGRADGDVGGEVFVNGQPRVLSKFKRFMGYVTQDDLMLPTLTPRETLTFAAELRMDPGVSKNVKIRRVEAILESLGLEGAANTVIGTPGLIRGISGGERKRTNIGGQLVSDPYILFVDEPTSGLDSKTAEDVVDLLRRLAHEAKRTVIVTIHQPSWDVLSRFDKLILIAKGRILFHGPVADVVPYFTEAGFPCAPFSNPADHFIEVLSCKGAEGEQRINNLLAGRSTSKNPLVKPSRSEELQVLSLDTQPKLPVWKQMAILFRRSLRASARNRVLTKARVGQTLIFALLAGIIYLNLDDNQTGMRDRQGLLFLAAFNQGLIAMLGILNSFPVERPVFIREYQDGAYGLLAYFVSKISSDLPFQVVFPAIFAVIVYWMTGLTRQFDKFIIFTIILVITTNVGSSIGFAISSQFSDVAMGLSLAPVIVMPTVLFSGFLINLDSVWIPLRYLKYISFIRYSFEALMINEFEGMTFTCDPGSMECIGPIDGSAVLDQLGREFSIVENTALLIALMVAFRMLAFLLLRRSVKSRR